MRRRSSGGRECGNTSQVAHPFGYVSKRRRQFRSKLLDRWDTILVGHSVGRSRLSHPSGAQTMASDGLRDFDPYPMVLKAAAYLIRQGPATRQERWEEAGGYSPSTLAVHIPALVCAVNFAAHRGDADSAELVLQVADWLERNIEAWTVTNEGTLLDDARRHYVRLSPVEPGQLPTDDAGRLALTVNNRPEGLVRSYPAREIVDTGFLELVRYGIRAADDPVIRDSIRVVDATLRWTHHLALAGGATTMTATVSARTEGLSWVPEKVAAGLCLRENEVITNLPRVKDVGATRPLAGRLRHTDSSHPGADLGRRRPPGAASQAWPPDRWSCTFAVGACRIYQAASLPFVTDGYLISFQKPRIGTRATGAPLRPAEIQTQVSPVGGWGKPRPIRISVLAT
jgi:hypothetical protein